MSSRLRETRSRTGVGTVRGQDISLCRTLHSGTRQSDGTRQVSTGSVYSLHKSSTRAHVARVAAGELRAAAAEVLVQLRFDLPASYAFHRRAWAGTLKRLYFQYFKKGVQMNDYVTCGALLLLSLQSCDALLSGLRTAYLF